MSHHTLPYLTCLKTSLVSLSAAAGSDPGAAMQGAIAGRLVDHMIVQRSVAQKLKADCYAALLKLLPAIEALAAAAPAAAQAPAVSSPDVEKLAPGNGAVAAIQKLKAIASANDIDAFDEFLQLTGAVRRSLDAPEQPQAVALCKAIVQVESDYCRQFAAAVVAQTAASAQNKTASAARNVKSLDEDALIAFIRATFPEESEATIENSAFISGGFSKYTVSISLANTKSLPAQIILRGDAGNTFGGASVVDEYRLIKPLYENNVCVPKPLVLEASGKVFGSPFLLMEKKPGAPCGHMFNLPGTNPSLCHDIAEKLANIHRVPLAAVGDQIEGAHGRSSDKARAWVREAAANWKPLNMPSVIYETAFDWLDRNADLCDLVPRTLVHADYGLNNLLIDNNRVSSVLDWEFAHIGNPAYDLGYFHPMAASLSSWEDFLQAYANAGMPIPDQAQLDYNILLAATRLGVMVCQTANVFTSGAEPGLAGAAVIGGGYYEVAILRIASALERVL